MAEEKNEEQVDIKDISSSLSIDHHNISFSDLSTESPHIADFSPAFSEAIEELAETVDFSASDNISETVIKSNTGFNETMREIITANVMGLQPPPNVADITYREEALLKQGSPGFPSEMDTEKLPPNIAGAIPRASGGISSLRTASANIKDSRYGFS
jgi:hypothetical protein|tara:strand:- start:133 stop:603 length:471 start_codon:yes stop_codon:yes gene_type:complete